MVRTANALNSGFVLSRASFKLTQFKICELLLKKAQPFWKVFVAKIANSVWIRA